MQVKDERQLRRQFCEVGAWMYERGYVVGTDGSLSARLAVNSYLMTPTGSCLGRMQPEEMVLTDAGGLPQRTGRDPTGDWRLHLTCYRERPEVRCVVHAHPPWCLAASVGGVSLDRHVLPDVVLALGTIPTALYFTPGTQEAADAVRSLIGLHDAVLLDHHGALTVGETLEEAFTRLESMELLAQVLVAGHALGAIKVLPKAEVEKLKAMRKAMGLKAEAVQPDPSWAPDGTRGPARKPDEGAAGR